MTTALKERIARWTPYDVIANILARAGIEVIPSDRRVLCGIFRQLQNQDPVAAHLLGEFHFSETDAYPFSRLLESVLARLHLAELLVFEYRPGLIRLSAEQGGQVIDRARKLSFSEEEIGELDLLGQEFARLIREYDKRKEG